MDKTLESLKIYEETIIDDHVCETMEATEPTLLNLPVELFLKICSFLDCEFLRFTLTKVCQRFQIILADTELWKYWLYRRVHQEYPALPYLNIWHNEKVWEDAYIEIDREYNKWINVDERLTHIVVKDVHFASVDAVLLLNGGEICVSGGRDRGLAVWKVSAFKAHIHDDDEFCVNAKPYIMCPDVHTGWIWDLAADQKENIVYSASWDNTVKSWDLKTGFTYRQTFRCGMAALSIVTNNNLVFAGLYSKQIMIFDARAGSKPIMKYLIHNGPVLGLESYDDKVASISEDRTMSIFDRSAGKVLYENIKIPTKKAYPVCMSWSPAGLYIGDSKGNIHLMDPELYVHKSKHRLWPDPEVTRPPNKVTAIYQNLGSMIVCSNRGEIKFLYNSAPPEEYMSLRSDTFDLTSMEYQNGVMVIGTCNSALEFWIPSERVAKV